MNKLLSVSLALVLLQGCALTHTRGATEGDARVDETPADHVAIDADASPTDDVPLDVQPDMPVDEQPDVPLDTPLDVPLDTPLDVPMDTPLDVPADVPPDVPVDAPLDVPVDVPPDVQPDAPPDVPVVDAPVDAPPPDAGCGGGGQHCCAGSCGAGLACYSASGSDACGHCGDPGEGCCPGSTCNGGGSCGTYYVGTTGFQICASAGASDGSSGGHCSGFLSNNCDGANACLVSFSGNVCARCGATGLACCSGNTCSDGSSCDTSNPGFGAIHFCR